MQVLHSIDGSHVTNAVAWLKDTLHVIDEEGEFILSDEFYIAGGTQRELFVKYGPMNDYHQPPNASNPRDNVSRFTLLGLITEIGMNFDALGAQASNTPLVCIPSPRVRSKMFIRLWP
jgi:hypothetical protein